MVLRNIQTEYRLPNHVRFRATMNRPQYLVSDNICRLDEDTEVNGEFDRYRQIPEAAMRLTALLALILMLPAAATAGAFTDARALGGLETVKVVVDVNVGEPKLLLKRIELIDATYTQLLDAGAKPVFVVAFRGPATRYVTRGEGHVKKEHLAVKKEVQGWISQFAENGFSLEQCSIAARGQKVPPGDILPEITVVQNGYISLVAYQNRGYALLPMD